MLTLWNKIYFIKTVFENFWKWGLKGGISIDTDSGPLGYVLWCCGSKSQDFCTFIQIASGHTVRGNHHFFNISCHRRHTYQNYQKPSHCSKIAKFWLEKSVLYSFLLNCHQFLKDWFQLHGFHILLLEDSCFHCSSSFRKLTKTLQNWPKNCKKGAKNTRYIYCFYLLATGC